MFRATRLLLAFTTLCAASHAAVIYDFSGVVNFTGAVEVFRYTAPMFIAADTFVPESALDSCSTGQVLPCFGVNFLPSGPDTPQHYPELTFQIRNPDNSVGTVFYYFPLGSSFEAFGVLTTVSFLGNEGTLAIANVPEPSEALPLIAGFLVVAALFLRPRQSRQISQDKCWGDLTRNRARCSPASGVHAPRPNSNTLTRHRLVGRSDGRSG